MASLSSLAGALSDRIEPRIVASFGMGLTGLGLFMFIFLTPATSLWLIIANLVFIGAGLSFFASPNNNAIMSSVKPRFYGIASSSISTMRLVGQSTSMAIAGLLISHYMGTSALTSSSAGMLAEVAHTAFVIYALLCLTGIFASLKRGSMNTETTAGGI
ncbi:MAG: MFS transporter [Syntrophomonadaceae bacterium]|nr:MFS transporter [Syntrophomonadaceae bacterium]